MPWQPTAIARSSFSVATPQLAQKSFRLANAPQRRALSALRAFVALRFAAAAGRLLPKATCSLRHPWLRSQVASMPTRPSGRWRPCRRVFFAANCARTKRGPLLQPASPRYTSRRSGFRRNLQHHARNTSTGGGEVATCYGVQTGTTRLRRLVRFHA